MKKSVNIKKAISIVISVVMMTMMIMDLSVYAMTYCTLTYSAGDVDNIVGSSTVSFSKIVNTTFDAAASSRFSRKGYTLKSWFVPSTGETVETGAQYVMPERDITFVANWEPEKYTVTFTGKGGKTISGSSNINSSAVYGTAITLPENEFIYEGYTFAGWKYSGVVYNAGDLFEAPALLSGSKIVFAAVWTAETSVTTPAPTAPVTQITTVSSTNAFEEILPEMDVRTFSIGEKLDYSDENYKIYNLPLKEILSYGTIDKLEINFRSSIAVIGQISMGFSVNSNGQWVQFSCNENVASTYYTYSFADSETCNKIDGDALMIGYWWGSTTPLYIDSVKVTYKSGAAVTAVTTSVPETTVTTTVTFPETTVTTTVPVITTTTTFTPETTPETSAIIVETLKPSQYSKVVEINKTIIQGGMLELKTKDIASANQIIESFELTFSSDDYDPINNYSMSVSFTGKDNKYEQFSYNDNTDNYELRLSAIIPDELQGYFVSENLVSIGYWWGNSGSLTLESIKVNYRIDTGDYNNDGVVGKDDSDALKRYMVGVYVPGYEIDPLSADVNGDNIVDVFDCMSLSRLLM